MSARRPTARSRCSYAKVNLGLEVLGLRDDGYHELRTLFQTIDLHDDAGAPAAATASVRVRCDHPLVPCDGTNLAARAAEDLRRYAGVAHGRARSRSASGCRSGGGLGGGSSNAAAVLLGLDRLWGLGLGPAGLHALARRLGADVPYFLLGGTALGPRPGRRGLPAPAPASGARGSRRPRHPRLDGAGFRARRRRFDTPGKQQ